MPGYYLRSGLEPIRAIGQPVFTELNPPRSGELEVAHEPCDLKDFHQMAPCTGQDERAAVRSQLPARRHQAGDPARVDELDVRQIDFELVLAPADQRVDALIDHRSGRQVEIAREKDAMALVSGFVLDAEH